MTQKKTVTVYNRSRGYLKNDIEGLLDRLYNKDVSTHDDRRYMACVFVNTHFEEQTVEEDNVLYRVGEVVSTRAHFVAERDELVSALDRICYLGSSKHVEWICKDAIGNRINEINEVLKDAKDNND